MEDKKEVLYVRTGPKLKEWIRQDAESKNRSMSNHAETLLRERMEQSTKPETKTQIEKIDSQTMWVYGRPINGADWRLIRKPGMGTYARVAAKNGDDKTVAIEEYSSLNHRRMWDEMPDDECAERVYYELLKIADEIISKKE